MKLSGQIANTLKFGLMMLIFSFPVFMAYSSGKKSPGTKEKKNLLLFRSTAIGMSVPYILIKSFEKRVLLLASGIYNFGCEYYK